MKNIHRNDAPDYYGGFDEKDVRELLKMMEMNFVGWASMNAAMLVDNPHRPVLTENLKRIFFAEDPNTMSNFAQATFFSDHRRDLKKAAVPSLIIQCSVDSIVPLEVAHYLEKHLKNSVLKIIDARGHYPNLSQPVETSEIILRYLETGNPDLIEGCEYVAPQN